MDVLGVSPPRWVAGALVAVAFGFSLEEALEDLELPPVFSRWNNTVRGEGIIIGVRKNGKKDKYLNIGRIYNSVIFDITILRVKRYRIEPKKKKYKYNSRRNFRNEHQL